MVLSREQVNRNISDIKENGYNYIVLDIKNMYHYEDEVRFRYSIEILNLINTVHWANKLYEKAGSSNRIDTTIFYKSIDSNMTNKPFTNEELISYYNETIKIKNFYNILFKFQEIDVHPPYESEFVLLGLTHEDYDTLNTREKENLHEWYGDVYCDVRFQNISVEDFIVKAKEIIQNTTNR